MMFWGACFLREVGKDWMCQGLGRALRDSIELRSVYDKGTSWRHFQEEDIQVVQP